MKKRITFVITMLLALVMSFALMACGSPDDGGETPPKKDEVVQKAISSLGEYVGALEQDGRFDYELDTAKKDKKSGAVEFQKLGLTVFYNYENDVDRMFELGTGLNYIKTQAGWAFDGATYPQNLMEYAVAVIMNGSSGSAMGAASGANITLDDIRYNSKSNTLSIGMEIAEDINRPLGPIQETYEAEGSVIDLLNEYIAEYYKELTKSVPLLKMLGKPLTVNKIVNNVIGFVDLAKDEKLVGLIGANFDLDIADEYEEFLKNNGITGEAFDAAMDRTVGEAIEGMIAYIDATIDGAAIATGDYTSVMSIINTIVGGTDEQKAALLNEVLRYAILAEVNTDNFKDDLSNSVGLLIDMLDKIKIKPIIDDMTNLALPGMSSQTAAALGITGPVVKEMIAERVELEKLGMNAVVKLNADYSVYSVKIDLFASHDYDGQTELPFLSDNDYSALFTLTPTGFSNDPRDVVIDFAPYDAETNAKVHSKASAVMRLDTSGVAVYHECRMFEDGVTVGDMEVECVYGNGETLALEASEAVDFDNAKSAFVFDSNAVNMMIGQLLQQGQEIKYLNMQATVYYGEDADDKYTAHIRVYIVPDASQASAELLAKNVIESLGVLRPDNGAVGQGA